MKVDFLTKVIFRAFTLAEVLITLGIIGIVAAMTLPALISKIEKAVLKSQIKKMYSTLTQVQQKVMFENGDFVTSSNFGYNEFNEAIIKSLKIIQVCEKNALAKGCIPKYQGLDISSGACPGFSENSIYNTSTVYVLNDGTFLIPYHMDWRSLWLVDVNGKKGPNKAGYDLFEVAFDENFLGGSNKTPVLDFIGKGCLNQGNPPPVKGGLDNYKNIDRW